MKDIKLKQKKYKQEAEKITQIIKELHTTNISGVGNTQHTEKVSKNFEGLDLEIRNLLPPENNLQNVNEEKTMNK